MNTQANYFPLPGYYARENNWIHKGETDPSHRQTLVTPKSMAVLFKNGKLLYLKDQLELDLASQDVYDRISHINWTIANNRAGRQFYIFAHDDRSGLLKFIISDNSTLPDKGKNLFPYTELNTRRVASFHCLCESVKIHGYPHPLNNFVRGDILPQSISDLLFEPDCNDISGMVYCPKSKRWIDIYLPSGIGADTTSKFGGTITNARKWADFVDDFGVVGKQMLTDKEFQLAAHGSPIKTRISCNGNPGSTGGHLDGDGRRIISDIGCEDMTGVLWQWLDDQLDIGIYILAGGFFGFGCDTGPRARASNSLMWAEKSGGNMSSRGSAPTKIVFL